MMLANIKSIFAVKSIRTKIIATLLLVLVYRLLSQIPVPGVNADALAAVIDKNKSLSFFSSLMGGGLEHFSIILMGLSPYINASIIMQLLGVIFPKIEQMQKEGEAGQRKLNKITRWLTLPLALLQSYGMLFILNSQSGVPILDLTSVPVVLYSMLMITTGTIFLMWLGEIMTEKGIGNGISVIITAGVLAGAFPVIMKNSANLPLLARLILFTLFIIFVIIKFTEGHRRIPLIYAKTGRDENTYFPIKINQAGMVPIIFAVSIATFPGIIGNVLATSANSNIAKVGTLLNKYFTMSDTPSWLFIAIYFLLIIGFSFFYVSITFNTETVAENIQKRGGYIPGIKPGSETSTYFSKVSNHLNLFGGSFLALIAVIPYIVNNVSGKPVEFIMSGAGLIIIVSVLLDVIRKVKSEMKMFDYSKYK